VGAEADGFITVYPCGQAPPDTSVLNYRAWQSVAASVLAPMGPEGICAVAETRTHLLVDDFGHFSRGEGLLYQAVRPVRVADTRQPTGVWVGRVPNETTAAIDLRRAPGWPANARGVTVNLTAVEAADAGFVSLAPCAAGPVEASVLNYGVGETVANLATVPLDEGPLCARVFGRTHLIVDVVGVYVPSVEGPTPPPIGGEAPPPPVGGEAPPPPVGGEPPPPPPPVGGEPPLPPTAPQTGPADAALPFEDARVSQARPTPTGTALDGGCACAARTPSGSASLLPLALVGLWRRRPRRRHESK
jgi:MYXO-CTERM domain-containing protein